MRLKRRCSYIQIHTFQPHSHTFQPPPHVPRHVAMPQLSCMLLTKTIGRITARSCSVPTAVQRHSTIMSAAPQQIGANKQFHGINRRFKHASTTLGNYQHVCFDTTTTGILACHTVPVIKYRMQRYTCHRMNRSFLSCLLTFLQDVT